MNELNPAEKLEKELNVKQIASHSSALTNLRMHNIEVYSDELHIKVINDPNIENIFGYYGGLQALFSYAQSLKQSNNDTDIFTTRIKEIEEFFAEVKKYWFFLKGFNVDDKLILDIKQKHGKNCVIVVQQRMLELVLLIGQKMRVFLQGMRYYFREEQRSSFLGKGIEGDFLMEKIRLSKRLEKSGVDKNVKDE